MLSIWRLSIPHRWSPHLPSSVDLLLLLDLVAPLLDWRRRGLGGHGGAPLIAPGVVRDKSYGGTTDDDDGGLCGGL